LKRGLYLGTKKKQKGGYIKGRREYYFIFGLNMIFVAVTNNAIQTVFFREKNQNTPKLQGRKSYL